jgi:type IV secretion system protein TrbE
MASICALAEDIAEPVCLQPLARLDDAGERAWAAEWAQPRP